MEPTSINASNTGLIFGCIILITAIYISFSPRKRPYSPELKAYIISILKQ